ncbi:MAG TPA: polysaccharide biosynthesis C-terminal domain-containing protein, partial [Candidatus Limnocylindrales bacterium]
IALNLVLIPRFGIVGASLSSLISYTFQAAVAVVFASRLSGQSALSLFVPGRDEIVLLVDTTRRLTGRARERRLRSGPRGKR